MKDLIRKLHVVWLRAKAGELGAIIPKGNVLIIAPHPDDEAIGCGGLIARLIREGRTPHVVVMTGGEGSHNGCCKTPKDDIVKARRNLTQNALAILGVPESHIHELNFPDGGIEMSNREVEKLKDIIDDIKPDSIFVPHWGEGWNDHVRTREIGLQLAPDGTEVYEYCVWMWYYNVWHGLDWRNARRLDMTTDEHKLKLQAMDAYIRPLAPCGHPWSGVLPPIFVKANRSHRELYFKLTPKV